MMTRIYILLLMVLCCSNGCNEQHGNVQQVQNAGTDSHEIKSIEIVDAGGELGYTSRLLVSADSIYQSVQVAVDSTKNAEHHLKNTADDWQSIVKGIDIPDFEKAVDGASRQPVDGIDTRISITTKTGTITRTNAFDNKTWSYILGSVKKYYK